jgi:hypothetical protein
MEYSVLEIKIIKGKLKVKPHLTCAEVCAIYVLNFQMHNFALVHKVKCLFSRLLFQMHSASDERTCKPDDISTN